MEVPVWSWGPWSCFWCVPLMIKSLSFKLHKNLPCLTLSRTLLKNYDTLLEFMRTKRFLTGVGVQRIRHVWSCQEPSWRMMTLCWSLGGCGGSWLGLGSVIMVWMWSFNAHKLKFQVWKKLDMFELSYDEMCWIKICWDRIGSDRGDRGEDEFKDQPRLIKNVCLTDRVR